MQLVLVHWHTPPTHSCPAAHCDAPPQRHTPEAHVSPRGAHCAHTFAPTPHLSASCPLSPTHTPPWQHPLQLVASHTHAPATQCCPCAHCGFAPHWHRPPPQLSARTRLHAPQKFPLRPQVFRFCAGWSTHAPALQHPLGQLVALQPSHCAFTQLPLHDWHITPPAPHAVFWSPVTHWFPAQHPAQLAGSHSHASFTQICPGPQATAFAPAPHTHAPPVQRSAEAALHAEQLEPGPPHEANVGVSTHCPDSQQPGQVDALHSHTPFTHACPRPHAGLLPHLHMPLSQLSPPSSAQSRHTPPSAAQRLALGVSHTPAKQHPVEQFSGVHPLQPPPWHSSPAGQLWQLCPPWPHVSGVMPISQMSPLQQPRQFTGEHKRGVPPSLPASTGGAHSARQYPSPQHCPVLHVPFASHLVAVSVDESTHLQPPRVRSVMRYRPRRTTGRLARGAASGDRHLTEPVPSNLAALPRR